VAKWQSGEVAEWQSNRVTKWWSNAATLQPFHLATLLHEPRRVWQPWWVWLLALGLGVSLALGPAWLVIGLLGGTAVFLLILRQPLVGLGLALILGPWAALESLLMGPLLPGGGLLNSGQLLLLVTVAAWLARGLRLRRIVVPHTFLNLPLALLLYLMLLTLINSYDLFTGFKELLKWVQMGLIVWLVVDMVQGAPPKPGFPSEQQGSAGGKSPVSSGFQWLLIALLLSGLSQALIGIWQFGLWTAGPEHFMILGRFYRAYGTFQQPNPFGGFMNLLGLLAWGLLLGLLTYGWLHLWARWRGQEKGRGRLTAVYYLWLAFAGLCAGAMSLALIFSWSRGAWLGFVAGLAVLLLTWPRRLWQGVALLALAGSLLLLAVQLNLPGTAVLTERVTGFADDLTLADVRGANIHDANYAVLERLAHWQAGLDMARDYPWLGVGIGNYEPAYADYALLNWPYALGHAHNYYINLLAETGIPGLFGYILFWCIIIGYTIGISRRLDWPWRGIALGFLAAWVGLSVHHLVDKLYVNNIYFHLGLMWALLHLLRLEAVQDWSTPLRGDQSNLEIS
jgi:putative inorganic carbon (hco3(-)) transporter